MEWSGQKQFTASKTVQFVVDGTQAGLLNSYGPLSFLKVSYYSFYFFEGVRYYS